MQKEFEARIKQEAEIAQQEKDIQNEQAQMPNVDELIRKANAESSPT